VASPNSTATPACAFPSSRPQRVPVRRAKNARDLTFVQDLLSMNARSYPSTKADRLEEPSNRLRLRSEPEKARRLLRVDQASDPDLLRCVTRAPVERFSARGFESGTHRGGSNLFPTAANSHARFGAMAYSNPWQKQIIIKSGGRKSSPGKRVSRKNSRSARLSKRVSRMQRSRKLPSCRPLIRRPLSQSTRIPRAALPPISR
jgi:hypothetical protein